MLTAPSPCSLAPGPHFCLVVKLCPFFLQTELSRRDVNPPWFQSARFALSSSILLTLQPAVLFPVCVSPVGLLSPRLQAEEAPLLPPSSRQNRRLSILVAVLGACALAAMVAAVFVLQPQRSALSEKYNLPDGVEPVDQLSFTQAEKFHMAGAHKLDDVSSR